MVRNDHCSCRGDSFVLTVAVLWYKLREVSYIFEQPVITKASCGVGWLGIQAAHVHEQLADYPVGDPQHWRDLRRPNGESAEGWVTV